MRVDGVEANVVSYSSVIHACAKAGQAAEAEWWLAEMRRQGVDALPGHARGSSRI